MARMIEEVTLKIELDAGQLAEIQSYIQKEITRALAERVPAMVADELRKRGKRK